MNISGIRPVSGFYNYNSINKANEISDAEIAKLNAEVLNQPADIAVADEAEGTAKVETSEADQSFGAYDFAKQYNPNETFKLKGSESDLRSLDVEKAVSDMQKDSAIHQYQYFVGQQSGAQEMAASVRAVENFSL